MNQVKVTQVRPDGATPFEVAYVGDSNVGRWDEHNARGWYFPRPDGGAGVHETSDYMEWIFGVAGGRPKFWIVSEASGSAYFQTASPFGMGYAPLGRDGQPLWTEAGLTVDTEGEFAEEHSACEAALAAFAAAVPPSSKPSERKPP